MEKGALDRPSSMPAIWASMGTAVLFEAVTVLETQRLSIWRTTPWRADPYHTAVWLSQFAVPILVAVIGLRLLARHAPDRLDRDQQLVRASAVLTSVMAFTLLSEWAAVAVNRPRMHRTTGSWVEVGGLGVLSAFTALAGVMSARCLHERADRRWRTDWLADMAFLCRRTPVLQRLTRDENLAWVRHRAMTIFVVASAVAGGLMTGAQAVGEGTTDPLFIAWIFVAATSAFLAFCVISNAIAGFIARPRNTRSRTITETSLISGCIAVITAIAFHDPLWSLIGSGTLTIHELVVMTLGFGVVVAAITGGLLRVCLPDGPHGGPRDTASMSV